MTEGSESDSEQMTEPATLRASNIGGIDTAQVEFSPGVTVLTGYNATNRTSLLRALNGALGGSLATLKSDAEEGSASLTIGGEEYTRTYTRTGTGVSTDGEPFAESEELVDLFVSLLEHNEVRRAVVRGGDLRDLLMRPVDTDAIERRVRELQQERTELQSERDRVTERRNDLPGLENRRTEIDDRIEEIDTAIEEFRAEVAEFEGDAETAEEANEIVDELDQRRQELSETVDEIELVESELSALEDELAELRADHEELADAPEEGTEELEATLSELRRRERELDDEISSLTTIIEFNRDVLSGEEHDLASIEAESEDVTTALSPEAEQEVVCWTCGSQVERSGIDDRLGDLESMVEEKRAEREGIEGRITETEDRIESVEEQRRRRSSLEQEIERTERKIEERTQRLDGLETTAEELREAIQELEVQATETERIRENDLLETYERLSELQYERGQLEQERDEINDEIAEIEALPDPAELAAEIAEVTAELEEKRTRISDLEAAVVEEFNGRMSDLLDILQFQNIARIWIERRNGAGTGRNSETSFDLHIVREDETGTVYEDVIDHLSESEREVIGLVVALAGYLAHEVHRTVPFISLDSLEAIDAERIAELVSYFADSATYLIVALLPEDAEGLPDAHDRVSPDEFGPPA
jgi:predicted  nucleic acid-binding Zn-ribbon protein